MVATDKFQDFLTWLANHNFQELHAQIIDSSELQKSLNDLLRQDNAKLAEKLDVACSLLSSIYDRIETLAPVVQALNAPTDALSLQATEILKYFSDCGAEKMLVYRKFDKPVIVFLPRGQQISGKESRFLLNDISNLEATGLIQLVDHNSSGEPMYGLTRAGETFASELPAVEVQQPKSD